MGKRGPATNCLLEQEGRGALVDVFTPSQCEEVWQQKELIWRWWERKVMSLLLDLLSWRGLWNVPMKMSTRKVDRPWAQSREIRLQTSMLETPVSLPLVNEIAQRESEDSLARTEKDRVLSISGVQGYAKEEKPIHKGNWGLPNSSGMRDATESLRKRVQQWKYYRNMDYEKEWMHHGFPTTADPRTMWGLGCWPPHNWKSTYNSDSPKS